MSISGAAVRLEHEPSRMPETPMSSRTVLLRLPLLALTAAAAFAAGAALAQRAPTTPPFRAAVEVHLAAIAARDLDALLPTLTRGDALTMIAPNGTTFDTRQQFIDFHRQWFATDDDGRYEAEIVRVIDSPALGHALIKYRYGFTDPRGESQAIESWLALTFALEDGAWRLVFDQNTALPPAPAERDGGDE
jgi:uncharacterized protein (TIGR02246 family)